MGNRRKREIRNILKELGIFDCSIDNTNNGHYALRSDELNRVVVTSSTPSDVKANYNLKSEIRKAMITQPEKKETPNEPKPKTAPYVPPVAKERKSHHKVSPAEKEELIRKMMDGVSVASLAKSSNVAISTLHLWKSRAKGNMPAKKSEPITVTSNFIKPMRTKADLPAERFAEAVELISNAGATIKSQADRILELEAENAQLREQLSTEKTKMRLIAESFSEIRELN